MNAIVTNESVDFAAIKQVVSMEQVLDHYGLTQQLRRTHDGFRGPCPIHSGHNPTQFCVSVSQNCWVCFGDCNGGGSVLDFVSHLEKVSVRDAALLIQQWFNIESPVGGISKTLDAPQKFDSEPSEEATNPPLRFTLGELDATHPYLALRGLMPETIATFGLGLCTKGIMAGRIAIPIHNAGGQLVAYAGRWPGSPLEDKPKYLFPRGFRKSLDFFNYHRALAAESRNALIVVEGFFDCMKVWQAGLQSVVAIMGSSLSNPQEELIVNAVGSGGKVKLMLDEDAAGRIGRQKAANRLACRVQVEVIELEVEGVQPDHLPASELMALLTDLSCTATT